MAKIVQNRRGELTKVTWQEVADGKTSSRSKQLRTIQQAVQYKDLVEAAGEESPSYVELDKHGLVEFGDLINPKALLALRKVAMDSDLPDKDKVKYFQRLLKDL